MNAFSSTGEKGTGVSGAAIRLTGASRSSKHSSAIVAALREQLQSGDKSLVGNKGYRRYLSGSDSPGFRIDEATIAEDAFEDLDAPVKRIAAPDTPVPFSPALEKAFIPQVEDVVKGLKELAEY